MSGLWVCQCQKFIDKSFWFQSVPSFVSVLCLCLCSVLLSSILSVQAVLSEKDTQPQSLFAEYGREKQSSQPVPSFPLSLRIIFSFPVCLDRQSPVLIISMCMCSGLLTLCVTADWRQQGPAPLHTNVLRVCLPLIPFLCSPNPNPPPTTQSLISVFLSVLAPLTPQSSANMTHRCNSLAV